MYCSQLCRNSPVFRAAAWTFQPALTSCHSSLEATFRSCLLPSIQVYLPCINWSVRKKNDQLYISMKKLMLLSAVQEWRQRTWTCFQSHMLVICSRMNVKVLKPDLKPNSLGKGSIVLVSVIYFCLVWVL